MTDLSNSPRRSDWTADRGGAAVQFYVADVERDASQLVAGLIDGWALEVNEVAVTDWIDPGDISRAACAVVQVDHDSPASFKRFERLAAASETPLFAASIEPPLALVRSLLRAGAHDVIPLPFQLAELEISLKPLRESLAAKPVGGATGRGKLIITIKGEGGVGATSLMGQLATRFAAGEARKRPRRRFGYPRGRLGIPPRRGRRRRRRRGPVRLRRRSGQRWSRQWRRGRRRRGPPERRGRRRRRRYGRRQLVDRDGLRRRWRFGPPDSDHL